jgi:hypothetical protein
MKFVHKAGLTTVDIAFDYAVTFAFIPGFRDQLRARET